MDPSGTISTDQTDFFGNRTRFGARGLNAENVLVLMSSEQVKIYMAIRRKMVGRNLKVNVIRYFPEKEGMVVGKFSSVVGDLYALVLNR